MTTLEMMMTEINLDSARIRDLLDDIKNIRDSILTLNKEIEFLTEQRDAKKKIIDELSSAIGDVSDKRKPNTNFLPKEGCALYDMYMGIADAAQRMDNFEFTTASVRARSTYLNNRFDVNILSTCIHRYRKVGFIKQLGYKRYALTNEGLAYYRQQRRVESVAVQD
jgi:hypothetical protein